jgi:hypothetical protein
VNDARPLMPHGPRKLKVATVSLAGCFGCHMSFLDIDERLFELIEHIEFDRSPLTDIKQMGHCDIGLIEGGLCNAENVVTCCANSAPTARRWWRWAPAPSTAACRRSATTSTWATMLTDVYRAAPAWRGRQRASPTTPSCRCR